MPELPEVETVARDLRPRLVGATIVGARVSWARTLRTHGSDGLRRCGRRPRGPRRRSARQAARHRPDRGRRADDPPQDDRTAVRGPGGGAGGPVRPAGPRAGRRPRAALPGHPQVRQGRACTGATRSTGELVTEVGGAGVFAAIGPEPLADEFTVKAFRRRLRRRTGRLKPLLLDQSFVAGVGNIYADESLWRARLHPLRTAGTLRPPDERRLYEAIRGVLSEAVERRGSSIDDYTAPDGDGSMQERAATSTSAPASPAIAVGGRSSGSSSAHARRISAPGASGSRRRPQGRPRRPAVDDRR